MGDQLLYEYDFGTPTETIITFMGKTVRPPQREAVRLLARNVPPQFTCSQCDAQAEYICTECLYECDDPFFCENCMDEHEHEEMFLPVTNSPRMGACGYEGELDTFAFVPFKE